MNSDSAKAFITKHTPCAQLNGRKGINLTSKVEKKKLERLFGKDRPTEGVLSQLDEPAPKDKPQKSRVPKRKVPKSREFIDETFSDCEVSAINSTC